MAAAMLGSVVFAQSVFTQSVFAQSVFAQRPGPEEWAEGDRGDPKIAFEQGFGEDTGTGSMRLSDQVLDPAALDTLQPGPTFGERMSSVRPDNELEPIRPRVLRPADEPAELLPMIAAGEDDTHPLLVVPRDAPYGFTGPSGVLPSESQTSSHFIPVEDRWRLGLPDSDRYGKGHPMMDDYPGIKGTWWDPFNQNVLKGDYPIIGQHTFLNITGISQTLFEARQLPTPTTPFEATRNPGAAAFFGDPDSFSFIQNTSLAVDLFHGNTSFKPADWRVKFDLIYNVNNFVADELGVVSPDVRRGTSRYRDFWALEEWFVEAKLSDLSPYYDFASVRAGSQYFVSDFRGFIFNDINRGVRLFGTRHSNRDQFNVMWLDQTEKDTNSQLNRIDEDRHQNTWIANYYRQDFLYPGYNVNVSFHANHDRATMEFDRNDFLVRPDPVGVAIPHDVRSYYFGTASNGHIERINVSSAFYYVFGRDDLNPIAGREVDVGATWRPWNCRMTETGFDSARRTSSTPATAIPTTIRRRDLMLFSPLRTLRGRNSVTGGDRRFASSGWS